MPVHQHARPPFNERLARWVAASSSEGERNDSSVVPGLGLHQVTAGGLRGALRELSGIWPEPSATLMRRHTAQWIETGMDFGEVLLPIGGARRAVQVGITGWYPVPGTPEVVGLRWHGILPSWRGRGLSRIVLRLLARRLAHLAPEARWICDTVLPGSEAARRHFEALGFVEAPPDRAAALIAAAEMPDDAMPLLGDLQDLAAYDFPTREEQP